MEKRIKPKWSTYIPLVQRLIVYSYCSSINTYPARILYGDVTPNRGLLTKWTIFKH